MSSRRTFLKGIAGVTAIIPIALHQADSLAATPAGGAVAARPAPLAALPPAGYQFFSAEEAAFVEAMVTTMCPTQKIADLARATSATIVGPATPRKGPYDMRVYQTTHITGGTAMGADPATENLFVVGASVYPQNSGYNPTGPLGALALRLGDDLASYVTRPRQL